MKNQSGLCGETQGFLKQLNKLLYTPLHNYWCGRGHRRGNLHWFSLIFTWHVANRIFILEKKILITVEFGKWKHAFVWKAMHLNVVFSIPLPMYTSSSLKSICLNWHGPNIYALVSECIVQYHKENIIFIKQLRAWTSNLLSIIFIGKICLTWLTLSDKKQLCNSHFSKNKNSQT